LANVLKGCVREVFKVMAQVDHDLTTVNCVDPRLRVIKNLGHHSLPPLNRISSGDSIREKQVGRITYGFEIVENPGTWC
jgi:hypothetical protein